MCHSIPLVHVVGFAETSGLSAFAAAWVLSLMSLSSIVGRIVWGLFADRHGVRLTLFFTLFIQGALVLWLVNTQDPVIFFLYAVVWGFGFGGVNTQYGVVGARVVRATPLRPRLFRADVLRHGGHGGRRFSRRLPLRSVEQLHRLVAGELWLRPHLGVSGHGFAGAKRAHESRASQTRGRKTAASARRWRLSRHRHTL